VSALIDRLDALVAALGALGSPVADHLRPGLDPADARRVLGAVAVHPDVVALFAWHDGIDDLPGTDPPRDPKLFAGGLSLLPLADLLVVHGDHGRDDWPGGAFPVLTGVGGDHVAVTPDGAVWSMAWGEPAERLFDSLADAVAAATWAVTGRAWLVLRPYGLVERIDGYPEFTDDGTTRPFEHDLFGPLPGWTAPGDLTS
jgi:hypothetical protein